MLLPVALLLLYHCQRVSLAILQQEYAFINMLTALERLGVAQKSVLTTSPSLPLPPPPPSPERRQQQPLPPLTARLRRTSPFLSAAAILPQTSLPRRPQVLRFPLMARLMAARLPSRKQAAQPVALCASVSQLPPFLEAPTTLKTSFYPARVRQV